MVEASLNYIPGYFTRKSVSTFLIILLLTVPLFLSQVLSLQWVAFNLVEVLLFFRLSTTLSRRWSTLSDATYSKKLGQTAFLIRVVWVFFSYGFFMLMTNSPFEFSAADSLGYHGEAIWLNGLLEKDKWDVYTAYIGKNYSDMGYPLYLGLLYNTVGESVLIPRLIKAVLSSITCLLVYKIGRNNFGESTGRMAGIMAMLVPNLIYYCGLHVKETEMVFLVVSLMYVADKLIRSQKIQLLDMVWLFLLGASLFFFRTVLACSLIGAVALATFFTSRRVSPAYRRIGLVVVLILGAVAISSTSLTDAISEYLAASDNNLESQMDNFATREGGNKFAKYGSKSIFLPFMFMVPFPTLVDTGQYNSMMLGGAFFTRNVYAFFVFVALITLYKRKKLREHVLIWAFILAYMGVLGSSGFALSERFHLPLVPFLLILAAYGVSQMNNQNKKYFKPYMVLVVLLVIGWNWFKLAGRS